MAYGGEKSKAESEDVSVGMRIVLSTVRGKFSSVQHLSTATLEQWLQKGENSSDSQGYNSDGSRNIVLLDTRPEEEFAVSHLRGAIRVDPNTSDIASLLGRLPQGQTIVCYCSLGYRSSQMAQQIQNYLKDNPDLAMNGARTVYNLDGSLFKWANEGRPMEDGTGSPTVFAHPFSAIWGRLLHKQLRRDQP